MKIGYLTSDLITGYNCTIWNGIREVCLENNATFLYFSGGILDSPDINQSSRNHIYDLVNKNNLDGLLINSATIFHYLNAREIEEFYKRFEEIPIINIGVKFRNYPTVMNDNSNGMKDLVSHILDKHKYKRIAFLSGPKNNFESNIRFHAFKKILNLYGIEYNKKLLAEGNFYMHSGIKAMEELLGTNISFDAVVCVNDDMATGAMFHAQSQNIIVPNELAITGFDDIAEAPRLSIPLTTVRQPIYDQARRACRILLRMIESRKTQESLILPTRLIVRRSCGCFSDEFRGAALESTNNEGTDTDKNYSNYLVKRKKEIIKSLDLDSSTSETGQAADKLIGSLITYVKTNGKDSAISAVDKMLNKAVIHSELNYANWQNLISELIKTTSALGNLNQNEHHLVQAFWQQIRILVHELNLNSASYKQLEGDFANHNFREVNSSLVRSFNLSQLMQTIRSELPKIDVSACYMCLYEKFPDKENPKNVRLIMAYNQEGLINLPTQGIKFPETLLIPQDIIKFKPTDFFIIEALFFEREKLGYILFQINPQKVLFEELRQQISSALKGALLSEEVETLLNKQKKHLESLQEANKTLKENQEKIHAIEKMVVLDKLTSLSRLTAGLAHELNTPLASIRASAKGFDDLINEYRLSCGDSEITEQDHLSIVKEMEAVNDLVKKAAERAVGFVQGMKMQTREPEKAEKSWFAPVQVINETVMLLNHTLRRYNCEVTIKPPRNTINMFGNKTRFSQVITNLLVNAAEATDEGASNSIGIKIKKILDLILISVKDNGSGIPPDIIGKIFDPMFTTKSVNEGTGLGLTIVHNIITGDFDGSIDVQSILHKGTTFRIKIPSVESGEDNG